MTFRGAVFITCILGHYYLISGVTALRPKISVVDKAVVARKGSTVTLMCSATRVRKLTTSSSWEFNGQEIKKRNNKIIIPEPHYQTNKRKGNFTLTIKNVSDTDVGTYACKVSKIHLDTMLEAKENIEVSIQEELLNVTSTQTNITLDEGSTTTLNCSVNFSGASAVDVHWLLNGKIVKTEVLHQEVNGMSLANSQSIRHELKHVTLAQSGIYTCGANSTIGLKTHDIAVNIRDTQGPDLEFTQKTESYVEITNGKNVTLSCLGIYPAALFDDTFWLFNGSQIKSNKHFEMNNDFVDNNEENIKRRLLSLTIYNARVEDSGKYECVLNTSHGLRRKNIKVYVTFFSDLKPRISVVNKTVVAQKGSTVTLICSATRVIQNKTTSSWEHNGQEIKKRNNKIIIPEQHYQKDKRKGNFTLTIKNVSDTDVGRYTCKVSNKHLDKMLVAKENIELSIHNESDPEFEEAPVTTVKEENKRLKLALYISLGLFAGVVVTIGILVKLYYKRGPKTLPSIKPFPNDEPIYEYDVFITYSRKDSNWVDSKLLSLLSENQVKYCIDKMHFKLGYPILDSIADSVYQSRYVLAVWSGSYAASRFCKQELDYALHKSFHYSDYSVILIGLESISLKKLPKPLRARTFLNYSDSVDREGWEKRLVKHLKRSAPEKYAHVLGTPV